MKIKFKKLHPDAKMPQKAHDDDFCYDVWAVSEEEVAPNVWKYGLGFAIQLDNDYHVDWFDFSEKEEGYGCSKSIEGFTIRPRSSIWKTGMVLSNSLGTIDKGYTGEVSVVFYHVMPNMPRYKVGDKIAQLHYDSTIDYKFFEVDELSETDRGTGSYGSTGK